MKRSDGRRNDELRPLQIKYNIFNYAAGSVQLEIGKTKVLCAITLQNKVPSFLKGKKTGWLTAEYAMLPTSTHQRIERVSATKRHGRYVEIFLEDQILDSRGDADHIREMLKGM